MSEPENHHYNKNLKPLARNLRKDSTKSEIRLWCELLSGKRMLGFGFRRQRPVGNYIADFLCKELNLIVEVDGYTHNFKTGEDAKRDADLQVIGFKVLRFSDREVMQDIENVRRTLEIWIEEKTGNLSQ
ncbi:endonuclease domain-containing protein [Adhaeribacter soli]|uniref:DUF559 domain-containing protein n=1 Tax=Adhaeribacter soli TaxID=2607655 RepID=A0A5N1IX81_9BACT|nr:DUF559 domain-containing protein [Adhaeribacter soli]KAA9338851.1 DUF559 domain-containing protein [Adhaeribacter soli]